MKDNKFARRPFRVNNRRIIYTFVLAFLFVFSSALAQEQIPDIPGHPMFPGDTTKTEAAQEQIANQVLENYEHMYESESLEDSTKRIRYWRITERTGEIIKGNPDTTLTDFVNRQLVEGHGIAMSYLGNLGLPAESRVYSERPQRSNFMFLDAFNIYTKSPQKFNFINTKIPYSNLGYISAGSRQNKEERLNGDLSINFGKKLNIGFNVDLLYARGFYKSQSAKHLDWVFYGSYLSDKHKIHAFINPADYINAENGGITNDLYITDPQAITDRKLQSRDIPTLMQNTWNHIKGTRYYLNYRYNMGFERETNRVDSTGQKIKQFVPVSSIIYTFDYDGKSRKFYSNDSINLDTLYRNHYYDKPVQDSTSYNVIRNTVGLSLLEGFNKWAKFGLTAFITQDFRNYKLITTDSIGEKRHQASTYIGGEISKRRGKILRYDAQGEFGVLGYNLGDFSISGNIETRIPVWGDTASLKGSAYIKNIAPTFYENTFRGKYFWWDNDFGKINRVYFGGALDIPHTKTNLKIGVENVTNYIYFNKESLPQQYSGSIQILGATLEQNLQAGILNWNNQLTYQTSSEPSILPLPDLSIYSNLFIQFKIAKVLTMQLGGDIHYFTKYKAPSYEPVTQQFHLQDKIEVGNFPLINAYVNCHLKYTRFFIEFYNLGSSFIDRPAYFSLPHYPVNPQIFKWGLSWDFNN